MIPGDADTNWYRGEIAKLRGYLYFMFIGAIIVGLISGVFCWGVGRNTGYQIAYEDMHKGVIEDHIKTEYPALWIKYNVKKEKKE